MRLQRMGLRNVRGVDERDLVFADAAAPAGVVIVEGANESGKSTLGDALDALLDFRDSTSHRDVRSLQTEGRDEGPEVEAELVAGPYRFTYRKRFLRRSMTELEIHEPGGERHTGDAAHERVRALLDETVDMDLWEALRLRQAAGLGQPDVSGSPGLAAALTQRTGAAAIGERELEIVRRAQDEYERYYTAKGKEKRQPLGEVREAVAAREGAVAELDAKLAELRADVERADAIEASLPALRAQLAEDEERARSLAAERAEADALTAELERCTQGLATAAAQAEQLAERRAQRDALVDDLARAQRERADLGVRLDAAEAELATATGRVEAAEEALATARTQHNAARAARQRAQADLDHLRALDDLEALRARAARVADARERIRRAEEQAEAIAVDDDCLDELRDAGRALDRAQAVMEAASPRLRLTAARQLEVRHGEATDGVAAADTREWTVRGVLRLGIDDVADLEVHAGAGAEDATAAHEAAQRRLGELLADAGVDDLDAAEAAHRRRRQARDDAAAARRTRDEALGDATTDELDDEIDRLARRVEAYCDERGASPPLPADVEAAVAALAAAEAAERDADAAVAEPEAALEQARADAQACRDAAIGDRTRAEELDRRVRGLASALDDARGVVSDEDLAGEVAVAEAARADAEEAHAAAAAAVADASPEQLAARADNAAAVAQDTRARLAEEAGRLRDLRARIAALGGDGLYAQREEEAAALEHARAELAGLERRAAAAALLAGTLQRHRAQVRERYAAPLRADITALGRLLHGDDFDVELDEDLRIARRRLDGLWLDLDQLSVGAQEQLALLGRLACATLVADQGGLLLFDDALGNTDPGRLAALGPILRLAGEHCQVVVLTCYPERYRHVGGARRLRLD